MAQKIFEGLIWLGGVWAGILVFREVWRFLSKLNADQSISLEYGNVQTVLEDYGTRLIATVRVRLINPNHFDLALRPESLRVRFASASAENSNEERHVFTIGQGADNVFLEGPKIEITEWKDTSSIAGTVDWFLDYGHLKDGRLLAPFKTLSLRGSISIHKFSHGWETRWSPDASTPHPVHEIADITGVKRRKNEQSILLRGAKGAEILTLEGARQDGSKSG